MQLPVRFLTTPDGVRLAFCVHGNGPPLVFVRGWISHLEMHWEDPAYRAYFEALAKQFSVIRYDMRGNGLSDRRVPSVDLDSLVVDLEALVDELDLGEVVLYGATYGGLIAVAFAERHPARVSKLVLDGGYANGKELISPERRSWILSMLRDAPDMALQRVLSYYTHPDPEQTRFRRARAGELIDHTAAYDLYALAFDIDISPLLAQVHAPTLVLHRRNSQAVPYRLGRDLAARLPNAHLVSLEGTAHHSWEGDATASLAAVSEFLGVPLALEMATADAEAPAHAGAGGLPEGATVILFLDIAGSTELTTRLGDRAYREKERALDGALRQAITEATGTPVEGKVLGDGIMAVFASARQAIGAARRCRDLGDKAGLPLHLGIHAGDVVREGNNVHGGAVQVASRVQSVAAPGVVLVSDVVRGLARTSAEVQFEDRGEHELKGISEPMRLYELSWLENS